MPFLAGVFGGLAILFIVLFAVAALFPVALAYVALCVRDARKPEPDPRLGLKTAFHLIHTIAILMILTGLSVSIIDFMSGTLSGNKPNQVVPVPKQPVAGQAVQNDGFNAAQRTAVALVGVGTLFALLFWMFLLRTNDDTHTAVRRVFVGGRMALCLLVTMGTVAGLAIVLIQKTPEHEATESLLGVLFVWLPAGIIHACLFSYSMREPKAPRSRRSRDEEEWVPPE